MIQDEPTALIELNNPGFLTTEELDTIGHFATCRLPLESCRRCQAFIKEASS